MKRIEEYIIEKFKISKDIKVTDSKYCDIYDIHINDIVMYMQGYRNKGDIYVQLYPARIEEINDNKLEVFNIRLNTKDEDIFTFYDNKQIPPVLNSFAFYHNKGKYWKALFHKDKGIKMINNTLKRYKDNIIYFGSFKLDGTDKRKKLEKLLDDLKNIK